MADVLVVGLDPVTGLEVHAEDQKTLEWRKKGHNGDQTLVCLACYQGVELPDGPRVIALVPKGREGGARCRHFAHPPGMAPPGGRHNPESLAHAHGKRVLRRWAMDQGFAARVEARTADSGLFTTAEHAAALFRFWTGFMGLADDVDAAVQARLDRRRVLYTGEREFQVVVEQQVLGFSSCSSNQRCTAATPGVASAARSTP